MSCMSSESPKVTLISLSRYRVALDHLYPRRYLRLKLIWMFFMRVRMFAITSSIAIICLLFMNARLRFWYFTSSSCNSFRFFWASLTSIRTTNKKRKTPPIMHIERGFMCRNTFGKCHRSGEGLKLLSNNPDTLWFLHHQPCSRSQSHHVGRINIIRIGACGSPYVWSSICGAKSQSNICSFKGFEFERFRIWHAM